MSEDSRIEMLIAALKESDLDPSERDALADDLQYAQTINGSPDPSLQGIKRLTISGVRREMLSHARTKRHEDTCVARLSVLRAATNPQQGSPVQTWRQVWVFVNNNSKTLIYCLTIILVVAILKGELQTLLDAIPKRQQAMFQYEPADPVN